MSDESAPAATTEAAQVAESQTTEESGQEQGQPQDAAAVEPTTSETVDQLPDWAQAHIKELRSENAKHRKAKTAAEKEVEENARKAAEEQGKFKELYEQQLTKAQEAEAKAKEVELRMLRQTIGQKHDLPDALVNRLQGETEEEIEADAKSLAQSLPKPVASTQTDSGAGTGGAPGQVMTNEELQEMAAVYGVSISALKQSMNIQE